MQVPFSKVRLWQVPFAVHKPMDSFPSPGCVVEEVQTSPAYRQDGLKRKDGGGQFIVTLRGRGAVRIDGTDYALPPGRGFLHIHKDPKVCYYYPPDGTEDWNFLWFAFGGAAGENMIREINAKYGYVFEPELDSPLIRKMMSFKPYNCELQLLSPVEGARLVMEMLELFCAPVENADRRSARSSLVLRVQNLIASRGGSALNISGMADRMGISREHLSRMFHEQTGETLQEYLTKVRIRQSVDLLLQTQLSGKEIAERCGYSEYTVFYRAFRKWTGNSPEQIRSSGVRPSV